MKHTIFARSLAWLFLLSSTAMLLAEEAGPKSLDPRLKIELFAEHPQIVTPTGIDIDHRGRVWAIESNTHQRKEEYAGHGSDRVLTLSDTDGDGRADDVVVFADGLVYAMSIAVRLDGGVYVATRKEVFLYHDTDGDGKADSKKRIIHLDTEGNYPHNGLAGFAFDPLGWMYIGLGENLGADYKVVGIDGTSEAGGGEGGSVYRCRPDGTKLSRWATGFWNPYASCFDTFGRMFTVDNDPDSRPPCRLLHTIRGGDYGYRYRNGRRGVHPFTAWNGEIPGTLPMVAGTGEAPSGIVAYESDGFPEEYIGSLLVGSWGDHRIDRFQLKPRGTSFTSKAEPLIVGGENFRPVGLAVAPDGSLFFTDWVLKDYPVHGKGRIWRVSAVKEPQRVVIDVATIPGRSVAELKALLESKRIEVRRAAARAMAGTEPGQKVLVDVWYDSQITERAKTEAVWALGRVLPPEKLFTVLTEQYINKHDFPEKFGESLTAAFVILQLELPDVEAWEKALKEQVDKETDYEEIVSWVIASWVVNWENRPDGQLELEWISWGDPTFPLAALSLQEAKEHSKLTKPGRFDWRLFDEGFEKDDPFIFLTQLNVVLKVFSQELLQKRFHLHPVKIMRDQFHKKPFENSRARLGYFLALRKKSPKLESATKAGLADPSPAIRRAAVQWVAEENLQNLRPQLETLLTEGNISTDLFEATLAGLAILDGVERDGAKIKDEIPGSQYVLRLVQDSRQTPKLRARALRTLDPTDEALNERLITGLLAVNDPELTRETVRTLHASPLASAPQHLRKFAADEKQETNLRAEAVAGLAAKVSDPATRELLAKLLKSDSRELQTEALRTLRQLPAKEFEPTLSAAIAGLTAPLLRKASDKITADDRALAEQLVTTLTSTGHDIPPKLAELRPERPRVTGGWQPLLKTPGDPAAGRRVFFHSKSAGCYRCHTINGRGGRIGPDLSTINQTLKQHKLVQSLIEPSQEIAPQFTGWTFVMKTGKVHTGLILQQARDGKITVGTSDGKILELDADAVEERAAQKTSIMPEKLIDQLTVREFRDLMAFLETLK